MESVLSHIGEGWCQPEENHIWSNGQESSLIFSADCEGAFFITLKLKPFLDDLHINKQIVTVLLNDEFVSFFELKGDIFKDYLIYAPFHLLQDRTLIIKLRFPFVNDSSICVALSEIKKHRTLLECLSNLIDKYNWAFKQNRIVYETAQNVLKYQNQCPDSFTNKFIVSCSRIISENKKVYELSILEDTLFKLISLKNYVVTDLFEEFSKWTESIYNIHYDFVQIGNKINRLLSASESGKLERFYKKDIYVDSLAELREKNQYLNCLEILLNKTVLFSLPQNLYASFTNICNLRCKMCYQSQNLISDKHMSEDVVEKLIAILPFVKNISLGGLGEPLIAKQIKYFINIANNLRSPTYIITNGMLVKRYKDTLSDVTETSISFDGATKETFELIRHGANFELICENIQEFRNSAPSAQIAFSTTISRLNLDEFAAIVKLGGELGVNTININPIERMPHLELKKSDKVLYDEQLIKAEEFAEKYSVNLHNHIVNDNFNEIDDIPLNKQAIIKCLREVTIINFKRVDFSLIDIEENEYHALPDIMHQNQELLQLYKSSPSIEKESVFEAYLNRIINKDWSDIINDLDAEILKCETELSNKKDTIKLPYCLNPFNLVYATETGNIRLCCHSNREMGDIDENSLDILFNSENYMKIRKHLFSEDSLPKECENCYAGDRTIGLEHIKKVVVDKNMNWDKISKEKIFK